jgi:hypothetical protein
MVEKEKSNLLIFQFSNRLIIALLDSESSDRDSHPDPWYLLVKSDKGFIDILEKE